MTESMASYGSHISEVSFEEKVKFISEMETNAYQSREEGKRKVFAIYVILFLVLYQ